MKQIRIGLIGFGTVGAGVVKLLQRNAALISRRLGARLVLGRIADLDLRRDRGVDLPPGLLVSNARQIIDDPSLDLVIELIGGIQPAFDLASASLQRGKHLITANKALLAERGRELFALAEKHRRGVYFEASVGGGIPIIKALREGLAANRIESVLGIINGTSNYILSRMTEEGESLETALSEAREKGYAEPDPSLDLKGIDSAHKLAILASLAFGGWADFGDIRAEGIGGIAREDIAFTGDLGYVIKLLAIAKRSSRGVELRVHPTLLPRSHLLATVGGALNAICVEGDFCGRNIFIGLGAGEGPAASAVVGDLIDAGRDLLSGGAPRLKAPPCSARLVAAPFGETECPHYIRVPAIDRPGVLARIASILSVCSISIASVIQRGRRKKGVVPIVLMTHRAREKAMERAIARIDRLDVVRGKCLRIRVEK
jgi:homoserine dehydrogenase